MFSVIVNGSTNPSLTVLGNVGYPAVVHLTGGGIR